MTDWHFKHARSKEDWVSEESPVGECQFVTVVRLMMVMRAVAVSDVSSDLSSPACQNTREFGNKLRHYRLICDRACSPLVQLIISKAGNVNWNAKMKWITFGNWTHWTTVSSFVKYILLQTIDDYWISKATERQKISQFKIHYTFRLPQAGRSFLCGEIIH